MNIHTAFSAGRLTLYLSGELDHHEARAAASLIDQILDGYLPRDCAVDMSSLSFMDSSGIAVIVRISRRLKEMGGRVWIENPAGQPRRVLDASGVDRLVPVAISR